MGKDFNKITGSWVYHSKGNRYICKTQEEYDKAKSLGYKDYPHSEAEKPKPQGRKLRKKAVKKVVK